MIKFFYEPDERIEVAIHSDDNTHQEILKRFGDLLGYEFEDEPKEDIKMDFDPDVHTFDRDTIIIRHNVFIETLLELVSDDIGIYIV